MEHAVYSSSSRWRMQPTCKIEEEEECNVCSIARRRGGEEERRSSPLFVLYLAMEYALYSSSSISQVGHLLHQEDEEYAAYTIARRRGGVHRLLLLSSLQSSTRHTPRPPAHHEGEGVGHLLHCEEERKSMPRTPSYASSPPHPCNGGCSLRARWRTRRLYRKEERRHTME